MSATGCQTMPNDVQEMLSRIYTHVRCQDIVKKQNVKEIPADLNVNEACQTLVMNNISSAPVYDAFSTNYLGMLDYRDLLHYVLIVSQGKNQEKMEDPNQSVEWDLILSKALRGEPVKVRLTTDLSRKNPFYSVLPESPILAAVEVMRQGVHRVNIMAPDSRVSGVLSQSDVLRHLLEHQDVLRALNHLHVKDFPDLVHRPVLAVQENENLIKAFKTMVSSGISSIAVIDADNNLLGNISISDVKYIFKHSSMRQLWRSCLEFISATLQEEGLEKGKDRFPFFDVTENASLAHVIGKLLATKTHRVWVVDQEGKLSGVISMTDLLTVICPESLDEN